MSGNLAGSSVPVNAVGAALAVACRAPASPGLQGAALPPWLLAPALAAGCAPGCPAIGAAVAAVVAAGVHGVVLLAVLAAFGSFFLKTEPKFLNAVFVLSAAPAKVFGFEVVLLAVLAVVVGVAGTVQGCA